ncbi:hypothetical protein BDW02DRAFT_645641 [Decorospora gaudefroyi]|uniref:Peptidase M43 pregnancy-associated plasma-A domain-containing protein n=1 Tax=Decorospora gaudefroyi TaxID=184978 RepID=A0A6A5KFV7_9PLEO|nr:hypothetical protein BDW02DRAFT_645641 [Decorospora gaudefroyi]
MNYDYSSPFSILPFILLLREMAGACDLLRVGAVVANRALQRSLRTSHYSPSIPASSINQEPFQYSEHSSVIILIMMFASIAFILPILAASATGFERCGTKSPTPEHIRQAQHIQYHEAVARTQRDSLVEGTVSSIDINVYYHVIRFSQYDDSVDLSALHSQTNILNDAYRPHGIAWHLRGAAEVDASAWPVTKDLKTLEEWAEPMQRLLRKGTYADLNVYILSASRLDDVLGSAKFPEDIPIGVRNTTAQSKFDVDGVIVGSHTLPDVGKYPFDLGKTLVHETGHWLDLFHTFEGGCDGSGDGIDDTPTEAGPHYGACFVSSDTCDGDGEDAIANYMNYSYDSCLREFTLGQEVRMHGAWKRLRAPHQA